jgi:serine protease Do
MKKWIWVALSGLLVWNIILSVRVVGLSSSSSDGSVVVHNKVDTNDISSVVESVKASIVSVESDRDTYSGVVVESDDESLYVITVSEVKDNENYIVFDSGSKKVATLVGYDNDTDICVLKCDVDFHVDSFSLDSEDIEKGQNVVGIGGRNSSVGNMTVSYGVCSDEGSYQMHTDSNYLSTMLETDMNVSEKQYGGALVDLSGSLVGIMTHHPQNASTHMSYAVSVDEIKNVYKQIKKDGSVTRGSLDITVRAIKDMESYEKNENGFELDTIDGLFVSSVSESSCANGVLMHGDKIIKINDKSMDSMSDFRDFQYSSESGEEVEIVYERNGELNTSTVVLK